MPPSPINFAAGSSGDWRIDAIRPIAGATLPLAERLAIDRADVSEGAVWTVRGVGSNQRYTHREEATVLKMRQGDLDRAGATRAVLIPIRKSQTWWALAQDERRALFEEQPGHIGIGLDYLPAIARRLLHARDLGEPFDFLTWFEFSPEHEAAFDRLLDRLRATPEWGYVEREIEVRLWRGTRLH